MLPGRTASRPPPGDGRRATGGARSRRPAGSTRAQGGAETRSAAALGTFSHEDRPIPPPPQLSAAMLACARIGAPFTVVFGGFSAEALAGRINDSEAKVLVTADGGYRKGNVVPLKRNADDAVAQTASIEKVLVVRRTKQDVPWTPRRDVWWHEIVDRQKPECPAESLESEHMLYLLYTSGTTANPKGIVP